MGLSGLLATESYFRPTVHAASGHGTPFQRLFRIFQRCSFILAQYRNHLKKLQNQLQVKEDELNGLRQKMRDVSQNSRTQFVTAKGIGIF